MLTDAFRETSKAVTTNLLHPCNVGDEGLCCCHLSKLKTKLNSVALVRERTIPTERPPPVAEVSANFCG